VKEYSPVAKRIRLVCTAAALVPLTLLAAACGSSGSPTNTSAATAPAANGNGAPLEIGSLISIEKLEEAHLRKVLSRTANLAEAAEVLGIDQATLYRKRKKIGLE